MIDSINLDALDLFFGITTVTGFAFGLYQHFKSRASLSPLIERLRASRSNILQLKDQIDHLILITEAEGQAEELLRRVKDSAKIIGKTLHHDIDVIDGGEDWKNMSLKEILRSLG